VYSALSDEVAVVLLADVAPASLLWGWSNLVRGPRALRGTPGLRFAKVLGSGFEGGFGLRPSKSCQGWFTVFSNAAAADEFADRSALVTAYRARSAELCTVKLRAWSCRGSWDGQTLAPSAHPPPTGPMAALTRASISLRKAPSFWRNAPAAQSALDAASGCRLAVGLGEAPLLRQVTFSVWDNVASMDAYARSGAHLDAIRAAHQNQYFWESMFARFVLLGIQGTWKGHTYAMSTLASPPAAMALAPSHGVS